VLVFPNKLMQRFGHIQQEKLTGFSMGSMDWLKGKKSPETMVFTIKYGGFL